MFDEFAPGMMFPRPEDVDRLDRYEQAASLYEGRHQDSVNAVRITQKLRELQDYGHRLLRGSYGTAEGTVWVTFNLPRLIVTKFADLQILQTPLILIDDEADEEQFQDRIREGVPDLWARLHYAKQLQRAFGDVLVSAGRGLDGQARVRVIDPRKWFPVLDANDYEQITAHQIAWIEDHGEGKGSTKPYLRVDVCYPDRVERRAFKVRGYGTDPTATGYIIESQVPLSLYWGETPETDVEELGGLMPCIHMANGRFEAGRVFGRPEFFDSGGLVDDISWRLSTWSDANDRVSHQAEVIPHSYLSQDEDGTVYTKSQYNRVIVGQRGTQEHEPKVLEYPLNFETLAQQYEASMTALLVRHEMAPALLGLQFGREKESGEAKSLGMGTTEAATRRDLLSTQPMIDRLLTVTARLMGLSDVEVGTHWRVGLPKSEAELLDELMAKRQAGLVTRRDMIEQLHPWLSADAIDAKLDELAAEREAEMAELMPETQAQQG